MTTPKFALEAQNSKQDAYLSLTQLWKNITMCESDERSRRKQLPNGGEGGIHPVLTVCPSFRSGIYNSWKIRHFLIPSHVAVWSRQAPTSPSSPTFHRDSHHKFSENTGQKWGGKLPQQQIRMVVSTQQLGPMS